MDEALKRVREDLRRVIAELNHIAQEIETVFFGIGEKDCALSLYNSIRFYQNKLKKIDTELSRGNYSSGKGHGGGFSSGKDTFGSGGGGGRF